MTQQELSRLASDLADALEPSSSTMPLPPSPHSGPQADLLITQITATAHRRACALPSPSAVTVWCPVSPRI